MNNHKREQSTLSKFAQTISKSKAQRELYGPGYADHMRISDMVRDVTLSQLPYMSNSKMLKNILGQTGLGFEYQPIISIMDTQKQYRQMMSGLSMVDKTHEMFKRYNKFEHVLKQYLAIGSTAKEISDYFNLVKKQHAWLNDSYKKAMFTGAYSFDAALKNSQFVSHQFDRFDAIAKYLKGYTPKVESIGEAISIDGAQFTVEHIKQITEEYFLDEDSSKNIAKSTDLKGLVKSIPKPVLYLLGIILAMYVQAIWQGLTQGTCLDSDCLKKQITHYRKLSVKKLIRNDCLCDMAIVNTIFLQVYEGPSIKSRQISELAFPCEVKIIKFKKKKKWAYIEWIDDTEEKHQGWIFGRYLLKSSQSGKRGNHGKIGSSDVLRRTTRRRRRQR